MKGHMRKENWEASNPKESRIFTPAIISNCIYQNITASTSPLQRSVFDICSGNGSLSKPWIEEPSSLSFFGRIDIEMPTVEEGKFGFTQDDFFESDLSFTESDLILCNPPFNGWGRKLASEVFLDEIMKRGGYQVVLFAPMGFRLNQRIRSSRWRKLRQIQKSGFRLTGILSLPLDIFPGVQFHSEVLFFNVPLTDPLMWIDE